MLNAVAQHKIESYWASYLGCNISDLQGSQTVVIKHTSLSNYPGLMFLRTADACIISVPPNLFVPIKSLTHNVSPAEVYNPDFLKRHLEKYIEQITGPSWIGYLDESNFKSAATGTTRLLGQNGNFSANYGELLNDFAKSLPSADWEHSGISLQDAAIFGYIWQGRLVAVGSLKRLNSHILNAGVVTHPDARGNSYGRAVVSAMSLYGLDNGALIQYRSLQLNRSAISLARSLGYIQYASTMTLRLRAGSH
jgi:GNAT superfamily N-acetyltransferase